MEALRKGEAMAIFGIIGLVLGVAFECPLTGTLVGVYLGYKFG